VVKNRYGVIILTLLLVFMTAAVITYVMPKKYESYAKMEIRPRTGLIKPFQGIGDSTGFNLMTQNFFNTGFEKIKSRKSLVKVVEKLDLMNRWGQDLESVVSNLNNIVDTDNIRGTDLIVIRVRYKTPEEARDIASEVADAYRTYRTESESHEVQRGLDELRRQVRVQEDTVEDARKLLANIVRTKGIIYYGADSPLRGLAMDDEKMAITAVDNFTTLETEKAQLESMINTLLKYGSEQLITYAAGLELPWSPPRKV